GGDCVKGSGLGLAICKGIVAAHGGTLGFETQHGRGTTMTAELRADMEEPAPLEGPAPSDVDALIPCDVTS
ncbi:MAG: sensor histidine kinase, partial [Phycisphaerae bacterium]